MSVYEEIGGRAAVEAVVADFYERVLADSTLTPYFAGVDLDGLKRHQRAFVAAALGGPDAYEGKNMAAAHAGLRITDAAFDAVVGHLAVTMAIFDVPPPIRAQIAAALLPYRGDIVTAGKGVAALSG